MGKDFQALIPKKIPDINQNIEKIIFDQYFPTGHYFYYDDFKMHISLKVDKNGYLVYEETISFMAKAVSAHTIHIFGNPLFRKKH